MTFKQSFTKKKSWYKSADGKHGSEPISLTQQAGWDFILVQWLFSCPQQSLGDYTSPSAPCPAENPSHAHPNPLYFFSISLSLPPSTPSLVCWGILSHTAPKEERKPEMSKRQRGGCKERKGGNRAYITTEFACMQENVCTVLSGIAFCSCVYLHACYRKAERKREMESAYILLMSQFFHLPLFIYIQVTLLFVSSISAWNMSQR